MKRINIYITLEQIARLNANSKKRGMKVSEQIRRALDTFLDLEEKR